MAARPSAKPVHNATDELGRALTVQELSFREEMNLAEAAGPSGEIRRWMVSATLAACVRAVDGVPCPFPSNRKMILAQADLVGSEGIKAVVEVLAPELPADDEGEADAAATDRQTAKN